MEKNKLIPQVCRANLLRTQISKFEYLKKMLSGNTICIFALRGICDKLFRLNFSYKSMCKNENLMNKLFLIILAFSMRAMTFGKKRESPYFLKI